MWSLAAWLRASLPSGLGIWTVLACPAVDADPSPSGSKLGLGKPTEEFRSPLPRPDLVHVEPLGDVEAPSLYSSGIVDFTKFIEELTPVVLRDVFGRSIIALAPPMEVRLIARKIKLAVALGELKASVDLVIFDASDRRKIFRERGDGIVKIGEPATDAELHTAVQAVLHQCAVELAQKFLGRFSAPPPPKSEHKIWTGVQLGGPSSFGASLLYLLAKDFGIQLVVNPLWPQFAGSIGGLKRLHSAEDLSFWLHAGATHEFVGAAFSTCAPYLCDSQADSSLFAYGRLELAWLVGADNQHRLGLDVGLHVGALWPAKSTDPGLFGRIWGGVCWHLGF
ncbi:MAG: hypothetical protein EXR77_14235 [Myxococcales bacterium]|nr:hypothetical protein [Myxococcales bacterium]